MTPAIHETRSRFNEFVTHVRRTHPGVARELAKFKPVQFQPDAVELELHPPWRQKRISEARAYLQTLIDGYFNGRVPFYFVTCGNPEDVDQPS